MKVLRHHTGSIVEHCEDDLHIQDFIQSKINSCGREEKDDPFFVCDLGDVIKKWRKFQQWLPRIEPFYAIKCNPDPVVSSLMAKLGASFDCASKSEIKQVLDMGVPPDKIIFANPCKQTSFIKFAAANNVKLMTFDNEPELHKIKNHYPAAELIIRIRVDDSKSLCKLGLKFGAEPSRARPLLEAAKKLDLNVIGVSFHVGSGCFSAKSFYNAVKEAKSVFLVGEEVGYKFHLLDVGGGFPGTDVEKISFEDTARQLTYGIEEFFPPSLGVRIIAEPGRFFVASAFTEACNITSVREVQTDNNTGYMYYLNDGVYGSFNCILFDHQYPVPYPLNEKPNDVKYQCSVWGPTCDSMDCITKSTQLPKLNIGDWICFDNMGAYTCAAASKFNGFKPASILYMCRRNFWDEMEHKKEVKNEIKVPVTKKIVNKMERIVLTTTGVAHGYN